MLTLALAVIVSLAMAASYGYAECWDMSEDYSITNNPSGEWSYGRKWTVDGVAFDLFTETWGDSGWWFGNWGHGGPSIQGYPALWAKNNSNGYPAVRWICPKSGYYIISGTFFGVDSRGVDNMVYMVINGTTMFTGHLQYYGDITEYYFEGIYLSEGEPVDFLTVWNQGVYSEYGWISVYGMIQQLPVKNKTAGTRYERIQTAYDSASTDHTIITRGSLLEENLNFAANKNITLIGGYNCAFSTRPGFTTVKGSLTIGGTETVTIANVIIK